MPYNPAEGLDRIMPGLHYKDVAAALEWLGEAFRLEEHLRWTDPETGAVHHAEMRYGSDAFMELSDSAADEGLLVVVDDVDEHSGFGQWIRDIDPREWGATVAG